MNLYYKAVRPDGTDFYTGTVDYAALSLTGGKLPRLPGGSCCTNGVYHAADVPTAALTGGSWPCRLFVVTGKPVDQDRHKFGFRTLRVIGELEAWQALGPNGREVVALLDRIPTLTPDQTERVAAAWDAAWDAAWAAARDAAWAAACAAARAAARDAAWDAAWAAARAVLVRDLITPEQFDVLYGPWASVMDETP